MFQNVEFFTSPPNAQYQNYCERQIQPFEKMVRSLLQIFKNGSREVPKSFESQLMFSYIADLMNQVPYSLDLEHNLLSPDSFIKMSNLSSEGTI